MSRDYFARLRMLSRDSADEEFVRGMGLGHQEWQETREPEVYHSTQEMFEALDSQSESLPHWWTNVWGWLHR